MYLNKEIIYIPFLEGNNLALFLINPSSKKVFKIQDINLIKEIVSFKGDESINKDRLEQLTSLGIIQQDKDTDNINFIETYKKFVFNYPFFDYNREDWKEYDRNLMGFYLNQDKDTKQQKLNVLEKYTFIEKSSVSDLLNILKLTFSPTFEITNKYGKSYLKTSPSGGYRHPTDCLIFFKNIDAIEDGFYCYLFDIDEIVKYTEYVDIDISKFEKNITLIIYSDVVKAMWRYREMRAYRPLLIDSGHIIQTIELLISKLSLKYDITFDLKKYFNSIDFSSLPIAMIEFDINSTEKEDVPTFKENKINDTEDLLLNPFILIRNNEVGDLIINILYPKQKEIFISAENLVLALTSPHKIPKEKIFEYKDANLFLEKKQHILALSNFKLYEDYNWLLSLYQFLNIYNIQKLEIKQNINRLKTKNNLHDVLLNRRTTRSFIQNGTLGLTFTNTFFKTIFKDFSLYSTNQLNIYSGIFNAETNTFNVYDYDFSNLNFENFNKDINHDEISKLTIGQSWAGSGDLFIWIVADIEKNEEYNVSIIDLGRIGQRICLLSCDMEIGVCNTPATLDNETCDFFNIKNRKNSIFYTFNLGYKKE